MEHMSMRGKADGYEEGGIRVGKVDWEEDGLYYTRRSVLRANWVDGGFSLVG